LPDIHDVTQLTRTNFDGYNGGLTASYSLGKFFTDFLAKIDVFSVNQTSVTATTHSNAIDLTKTQFQNNSQANDGNYQFGCIETTTSSGSTVLAPPFFGLTGSATDLSSAAGSTDAQNFILANNIGLHYDLAHLLFVEPSVGVRYVYSSYGANAAALGLADGYDLRLEAGGKLGFARPIGGDAIWTGSVGAYVYEDVLVHGLVVSSTETSVPSDEGKVRLRGILQNQIDFGGGVSAYAELNGRYGEEYWAIGGKVGGRIRW